MDGERTREEASGVSQKLSTNTRVWVGNFERETWRGEEVKPWMARESERRRVEFLQVKYQHEGVGGKLRERNPVVDSLCGGEDGQDVHGSGKHRFFQPVGRRGVPRRPPGCSSAPWIEKRHT